MTTSLLKTSLRLLLAIAAAALIMAGLVACGGAEGTRPTDMSHDEHVAAAQQEDRVAAEQQAAADQSYETGDPTLGDYETYTNVAAQHREHAEAHRRAADTLRVDASQACREAEPTAAEVCPLVGPDPVLSVESLPRGARVVLDTPDAERVRIDVECHHAHAVYLGFEGMEDCPFYLRNVTIDVRRTDDGRTQIDLTASEDDAVDRIRALTVERWQPTS